METIEELEKYLEDECYSFNEISVGSHHAYEGIIIEKTAEGYIFGYSERGNREIIKTFQEEKNLVAYALAELNANKWYKGHLVAWAWSEKEIKYAEKELKSRNIGFIRNDIPDYQDGKRAYRIFVFGRDILLLDEFKKRYWRV